MQLPTRYASSLSVMVLAFRLSANANAQTLAGIPPCARDAALAGIQTTGCASTDIACICKATSFLASLQSSLGSICGEADQRSTIEFAVSLCTSFGQSISVPSSSSEQVASRVLTSEISVPTETGTPVDTAILLYTDSPAPTAPAEGGSSSSPSSLGEYSVSTYLTSSTTSVVAAAAPSPSSNNTRNNNTVAAPKPLPFQGTASSLGRVGLIAPGAALFGAAGLAFWL